MTNADEQTVPLAAITLKDTDTRTRIANSCYRAQSFERAGTLALTITSPAYTKLVRPGNTEVGAWRAPNSIPRLLPDVQPAVRVHAIPRRGIAPPRCKPATTSPRRSTVYRRTSSTRHGTASGFPSGAAPSPPPALAASCCETTVAFVNRGRLSTKRASEQPRSIRDTLPTPMFRSTTRLVQVDVVVTDKAEIRSPV